MNGVMKGSMTRWPDALRAATADFDFAPKVTAAAQAALDDALPAWEARDAQGVVIGSKVIRAFAGAGITDWHLAGSTGYGYHDAGRDVYEALIADLMGSAAAFVRLQLVSGTHAIVAAVNALLGAEGRLCSLTGSPYDTLRMALVDPLLRSGDPSRYDEVPWPICLEPASAAIQSALRAKPDVVFIQRSRGYAPRTALTVAQIGGLATEVQRLAPSAVIVVDNCYGEFVELLEPSALGALISIGSLIKNPGGGLAPGGAYIAGPAAPIEKIADSIFARGLGRKVGPTFDTMRLLFAGLHRAPRVVAESLKIMDFAGALFSRLGYTVDPQPGAARGDIIQAIRLETPQRLAAFSQGMQLLLPVNARARPEPGPVPGYADPVLMAGGSFISGSTMELSCDAPLRPPYEVYVQGGLDLTHGMLAMLSAANQLEKM